MDALSIASAAERWRGRPAIVTAGGAIAFEALERRARRIAAHLAELAPGSPVTFPTHDGPATIALVAALLGAGRMAVPLHARWTEAERANALARLEDAPLSTDPSALVADADAPDPPRSFAWPEALDPRGLAACLFTAGSQGAPKAVLLERRAFVASASVAAKNVPLGPGDRWLLAMPLAHAGGLSIVTRCLASGAAVVPMDRFDPADTLDAIDALGVTRLSVVPAMLRALMDRDARGTLARVGAILVGGGPWDPRARGDARARGLRALATYGLTETCSQIATARPGSPVDLDATAVGPALEGIEITAPRGETGPIAVRGPTLMRGYAGERPLDAREPWPTGDLGFFDERGVLHVVGRADETIVTGGENVHPAEVEAALLAAAPSARGAVVFGVPDPTWGEIVAAAVEASDDAALASALGGAARALAPYKRPRLAVRLDALDRTASGKIDRGGVRAAAIEALTRRGDLRARPESA